MLNALIAMMLMIKLSGLPMWISIPLVIIFYIWDLFLGAAQSRIEHLRFLTVEKALHGIIDRFTVRR